jgi:AmpE protein
MVLALLVRPYLEGLERYRDPAWMMRFFGWVDAREWGTGLNGWWKTLLALLPLILAGVALQWITQTWLWGLGELLLGVICLIYVLGTQGYSTHLEPFLDACEAQDETAMLAAAANFSTPESPIDPDKPLLWQITCHMLTNSNERVFAVLFWFVVLGPIGALGVYLAGVYRDYAWRHPQERAPMIERAEQIVWVWGWIPARLAALSFAVVGSFVDAWERVMQCHSCSLKKNEALILEAGLGAIRIDDEESVREAHSAEEVRAVRDLISRTVILWVAVTAVATLIGVVV